jgi:uncharacterized membrane protein
MVDTAASNNLRTRTIHLAAWSVAFVWFTVIIPVILIMLLPSDQRVDGIATLATTPVIEYLAVSVGLGLGLSFPVSFSLTVFPCIGFAMLVTGIVGFLTDSSERATKYLNKVRKKVEKYPRLQKYGVVSNFFFIMFFGMYISPGVSIILGWSRIRSVFFMILGICTITFVIALGTMGIINLFFVD